MCFVYNEPHYLKGTISEGAPRTDTTTLGLRMHLCVKALIVLAKERVVYFFFSYFPYVTSPFYIRN